MGREIEYDVRGKGPAVLFFHAFPLGLFMWDAQAEALAPTHQVIRFDARGFGGSPPGSSLLTMERIADDGAALLDHLGVGQAVVGGCSMGGYAAFAFVRRHPDRLKGLVLQDTRAGADNEEARKSRATLAEKVRREGAVAAAEAFLPRLLGETTHKERPEVVAGIRQRILATSPQGIADALAGLAARADSLPTLREVRVPTLVVCGAEDVLTPVAESEAIHKGVAGSRLEVIPRAGHLANLENPAAYDAALLSFLGQFAPVR
ncbi:MAG: alpha/beta hydrolase [Acidobacteria bacterium]|nr:MAG: alpha/beta hydrolase [Acidobacteriota bacterium]